MTGPTTCSACRASRKACYWPVPGAGQPALPQRLRICQLPVLPGPAALFPGWAADAGCRHRGELQGFYDPRTGSHLLEPSYYCGKGITRSSYAGIIFALVFSLSQYHLQNIYTRFAVGEVTAFIFLPFILYGLYNLIFEKFEKPWLLVAGFSGLMLTHTISLGLATLASVIVALVGIKPILKDPRRIPRLLAAILAVLALTCGYWIPVVEQLSSATFGLTHSQATWVQVSWSKSRSCLPTPLCCADRSSPSGFLSPCCPCCAFSSITTLRPSPRRKIINWTMGFGFFFLFLASDLFPWQLAPSSSTTCPTHGGTTPWRPCSWQPPLP